MNIRRWAVGTFAIVLVAALCSLWATPAQAIKVWDFSTGAYINPTWFVNPSSPAGGTVITVDPGDPLNYEIQVGAADFGAAETDTQTMGIYGAGALLPANNGAGYRIEFTTQVYGWDSYNVNVPAPGSTGYWDVFSVNINQEGTYYWNQVNGGTGPLSDPIITPDAAGNCVMTAGGGGGPCQAATTNPLGGETWAWGALDYGNHTFESNAGAYTLTLVGGTGPYYLSAVLDTATSPNADNLYPSFGAFNPLTPVPPPGGVPEPASLLLLGSGLAGLAVSRRKRR